MSTANSDKLINNFSYMCKVIPSNKLMAKGAIRTIKINKTIESHKINFTVCFSIILEINYKLRLFY